MLASNVPRFPPILSSEAGARWLEQFDEKDREQAIEYAGLLELIDQSAIEQALSSKIEELLNASDNKVAIYAVRPRKFLPANDAGTDFLPRDKSQQKHFSREMRYFENRDIRPTPLLDEPGSEGRIAHLIETLVQSRKMKAMSHPSIAMMAKAHVRKILFVTDFIGTGTEVAEFLWMFHNSKACMSWTSRKYIHYTVLCYASTRYGGQEGVRQRLAVLHEWDKEERKRTPRGPRPLTHCAPRQLLRLDPEIISCRIASTADELLRPSELLEFERFCTQGKYFQKTRQKDRRFAFGYKNKPSLMVFSYRCPNNVPCIFWSNNPPFWHPVFPARRVMPDQNTSFVSEKEFQRKIAERRISTEGVHSTNWVTLIILDAIRKGIRRLHTLSRFLQLSKSETEKTLHQLVDRGLIDEDCQLTVRGKEELSALERGSRIRDSQPPQSNAGVFYFPRFSRGTKGTPSHGRNLLITTDLEEVSDDDLPF